MKTINAIIIEDEPLVASGLMKLIREVDPSIKIIELLDSLHTSIAYFKINPEPDLIFMDIQLSDGVSFDLLKEVSLGCPIIFTTAYDEYAIRAFKLNSIDYLLKPVDKSDLELAISKFKRLSTSGEYHFKDQIQQLLDQWKGSSDQKRFKERFLVHSGKTYIAINQANVAFFEKDALIYLITKENRRFITDIQTMEEVEELVDPELFFRANRQIIIRSDVVANFQVDTYGKLLVKLISPLNLSVDISREKAISFKKWLQK